MNETIKTLLWPLIKIRRMHDAYLVKHHPEKMFSIWHKRATDVPLNIDNPITLDDKIAYLAFRTDTSEWTKLADKVRVREYVEECGYGEYLPKLYGTWEHAADIDFEKLPNAFVIKTNNASATNILVRDKSKIDENAIRKQLDEWLKIDYGYRTCQPHYSKIKPLMLAEEFLGGANNIKSLNDYKFYCVNGRPLYCIVYTDRVANSHDMKRTIYDMDWQLHQEYLGRKAIAGPEIKRPASFEKMKEIASALSAPFPFVRVDFYEINGAPVFGEMTFTPGMQETSVLFSKQLGDMIDLNDVVNMR